MKTTFNTVCPLCGAYRLVRVGQAGKCNNCLNPYDWQTERRDTIIVWQRKRQSHAELLHTIRKGARRVKRRGRKAA
jgi:hypothetical protein